MTSRQSCDVKSEYQNIVRMEYQMNSGYFYAMLSRMKYINRWGLMRNTKNENLLHMHWALLIMKCFMAV